MIKNLSPNWLLVATVALLYTSCKKDSVEGPTGINGSAYSIDMSDSADNNRSVEASLSLSEKTVGGTVPDDFLGFSFEKQILTDPEYLNASNTTFINLFKNLDAGLIRIGGASVDKTFWSEGVRTSADVTDSIYTNDVMRYKAFAQSVGWKTIWGLNLGTGNPKNDADEAKYVSDNLGSQILSFAIGNEPAYLGAGGLRPLSYDTIKYLSEFNDFSSSIKTRSPGIIFSGPENEVPVWGLSFMRSIRNWLNMLTVHYYQLGPANDPSVTMNQLMTFDPGLQHVISDTRKMAQSLNLPFRITECNSVWGGGQRNMSDAYAASLWGSEFLFYTAQQGAAGINFHTGGPPVYVYSPISTVNGKSVARPLYYAMLLFHQANIGKFISSKLVNSSYLNIDAFSFISKNNKKGIMLINKDPGKNLLMTISNPSPVQTATVYQLKGDALTSQSGISINKAVVNDDGLFSVNGRVFNLDKANTNLLVKVKPISAILIFLE